MREILEDAQKNMDAGYGRAQAHAKQARAKRFYKIVSVAAAVADKTGFEIHIDGRATKTPSKKAICVPSRPLAEQMAKEWAAQDTHIVPLSMPLVRLVNAAIEGGEASAKALRDEIIKYAGNDLLLFRADSPVELAQKQAEAWDSALAALARHFGISFQTVIGIIHVDQPDKTIQQLALSLDNLDYFSLTALTSITGLTGSGLLAISLNANLIAADRVWDFAHVDEDYNIENWGEDYEAANRRKIRRTEFDAAVALLQFIKEN